MLASSPIVAQQKHAAAPSARSRSAASAQHRVAQACNGRRRWAQQFAPPPAFIGRLSRDHARNARRCIGLHRRNQCAQSPGHLARVARPARDVRVSITRPVRDTARARRGGRHRAWRRPGPRPDERLLRQPALEGLTRSARTDSPRKVGQNDFPAKRAAAAAAHTAAAAAACEKRGGAAQFRLGLGF
ncbi:hypothetical protein F511_18703 [Dorcoceras hygrometricum]|uniref:Uncharacterized protein n=1 Tax=Dorcoceras hygrometricum TaxID=472368 RepID=A0A2Z7BVT6_9LAMI|nr:hypothetical protein F511_18703 [Dorcoceras hygrometricum]